MCHSIYLKRGSNRKGKRIFRERICWVREFKQDFERHPEKTKTIKSVKGLKRMERERQRCNQSF